MKSLYLSLKAPMESLSHAKENLGMGDNSMEEFLGQTFKVDLADDYGCAGFMGTITAVHGAFMVFKTPTGEMIVNEKYIKSMLPREAI